ncbi:hypothetical protein VTH06DRAFT_1082 [Thermothelomyces fergusii]
MTSGAPVEPGGAEEFPLADQLPKAECDRQWRTRPAQTGSLRTYRRGVVQAAEGPGAEPVGVPPFNSA